MVESAFITNSRINMFSGGGIVSKNIVEALQEFSDLKYILSNEKPSSNQYENIPCYCINPGFYYPNWQTTPFFQDYMAFHLLPREHIDLALTYACPFGLTVEELKREFETKIICDLAPHNIEISREEHMRFIGRYPFPHLTNDMLWGLYSRHLRFADQVIVHGHDSAEYIKTKARLKNDPVVIPHGCYLPETIPEYPGSIIPGYFGNCGFDKGIMYAVNAWIYFQHPSEEKMVIGGREAKLEGLEEKYLQQFKQIGETQKLQEFYKQINIYIQPSVVEGFGIPALEAMAYGRPLIIAEGAPVHELITDGKEGFRVPIRDVNEIILRLQYFKDNPSEIKRMGAEARRTAEKYTWKKIKKQYQKQFEEIL